MLEYYLFILFKPKIYSILTYLLLYGLVETIPIPRALKTVTKYTLFFGYL